MTLMQTTEGIVPTWELADRMTRARRYAGLTIKQLAARSDVSEKTISRIESGRTEHPTRAILAQLALACGISRDWLVLGERAPGGDESGRAFKKRGNTTSRIRNARGASSPQNRKPREAPRPDTTLPACVGEEELEILVLVADEPSERAA